MNLIKTRGATCASEEAVSIDDLREGMVLSRPVYSSSGKFLLSRQAQLRKDYITKLRELHKNDPITDVIYVTKGSDKKQQEMTNH